MAIEIRDLEDPQIDNLSNAAYFAIASAPGVRKDDGTVLLDTRGVLQNIVGQIRGLETELADKIIVRINNLFGLDEPRLTPSSGSRILLVSDLSRVIGRSFEYAQDGEARFDHILKAVENDSSDKSAFAIRELSAEERDRLYKASQQADISQRPSF